MLDLICQKVCQVSGDVDYVQLKHVRNGPDFSVLHVLCLYVFHLVLGCSIQRKPNFIKFLAVIEVGQSELVLHMFKMEYEISSRQSSLLEYGCGRRRKLGIFRTLFTGIQ